MNEIAEDLWIYVDILASELKILIVIIKIGDLEYFVKNTFTELPLQQ